MIQDAINTAASEAWAKVIYYATFQFLNIDPFWRYAGMLVALYVVVLLLCWFFGSFWPVLRVIGGFLLVGATFGLFAYAKGEADARAHDKARNRPPVKPKAKPDDGGRKPFG